MKKRIKMLTALLALTVTLVPQVMVYAGAAPDGKTDAETTYGDSFTDWKTNSWDAGLNKDWTQVSLTPGTDETSINLAWYSKDGESTSLKYGLKSDLSDAKNVTINSTDIDREDKDGTGYTSNKAVITGLAAETTYYYQVEGKSIQSFTTGALNKTTFAFVGDPQIGSSNTLKGQDSQEFYTAQSNAVANDSYNWSQTLNKIKNTGVDFIISAGDQIQTTAKKAPNKDKNNSEIEYAGYLSPEALTSLPVATTVGNHDADNENYTYHFNLPNVDTLGSNGIVGGDYYFTYDNILFMMLNTQDTNSAEHIEFIKNTVEANSDCKWIVVTLHQDIYGSAEHSNEPEIVNLRYALTPAFEKYGVDVVLTGHDHAYSRSKFLSGDEAVSTVTYTNDQYRDMQEKDTDYSGSDTIFTAPGNIQSDTSDSDEQAYLEYLNSVMDSDRIKEDTEYAVDPEGIMYLTAGSSSGSKYYDLVSRQQSYIANRWQEDVPTYSVIDVTETTMTINTYRTDTGSCIDNTVTIVKTADQTELNTKLNTIKNEIANGSLNQNDYTETSWNTLQEALAAVQLINEQSSQAEINLALEKLSAARSGLQKKQTAGNSDGTDSTGDTGKGSNNADKADENLNQKVSTNNTASTKTAKVKTGDENNVYVWYIACTAGIAVIAGGVVIVRRRKAGNR